MRLIEDSGRIFLELPRPIVGQDAKGNDVTGYEPGNTPIYGRWFLVEVQGTDPAAIREGFKKAEQMVKDVAGCPLQHGAEDTWLQDIRDSSLYLAASDPRARPFTPIRRILLPLDDETAIKKMGRKPCPTCGKKLVQCPENLWSDVACPPEFQYHSFRQERGRRRPRADEPLPSSVTSGHFHRGGAGLRQVCLIGCPGTVGPGENWELWFGEWFWVPPQPPPPGWEYVQVHRSDIQAVVTHFGLRPRRGSLTSWWYLVQPRRRSRK